MKKSTPKPPENLSHEAKQWWRKLADEYALDDAAALLILQTALEALDRMRAAQEAITSDGEIVKDRFGQFRAHPAVTIERDARAAMLAALKALNLDLEPLRGRTGRLEGG